MKWMLILVSLLSVSAFAAEQNSKTMGLEEIKEGCTDPSAWHNQVPPTDITITCKHMSNDWIPGPSTYGSHPRWKKICGSLVTDKPNLHVHDWCWPQSMDSVPWSCPTFQETMSNTSMDYKVTCAQVLAMTSIKDFCASQLALEIEANESILTVTKTGKTMSLCSGATVTTAGGNTEVGTRTVGQK